MNKANILLSEKATKRLNWFIYQQKFKNARLTCRHFGISPSTFYHWKKKYVPSNPLTLEDISSRRPHTPKKTRWTFQTLILINQLLEQKPDSRNVDIQLFLTKQGVQLSASTISRIMKLLRRKNTFS